MSNDLGSQPAIVIFDKGRAEACGVAPVGVADPTFFAPVTKVQREAGGVRGVAVNDAGQMVDAAGTVGGVPVSAEVDPITGMVEIFGASGKKINVFPELSPVVLIGGDHPYLQWYGRNGKDGAAGLYASKGIVPYVALNTRSMTGEGVGDPGMMTWQQLKELSNAGLIEPIAHGARHYQDWEAPDAGIAVKYTGPAATATMYVTTTSVVGTTAGGVDDFSFDFSSYQTLSQVVSAIDGLPNWSAIIAPELSGQESSENLLTISSANAKNCKTGLPDGYGQRFSAAGGIRVFWDSRTTPTDSFMLMLTKTALNVIRDGVLISQLTLASYTLSELLAAIVAINPALASVDALAGRNITSLVNDNGAYPWCSGVEDATNLSKNITSAVILRAKRSPAVFNAGLTSGYLREMNMRVCKSDCAAAGVNVLSFAQSGGNFWKGFAASSPVGYVQMRGDVQWNGTEPCATKTADAVYFHGHAATAAHYDTAEAVNAWVDAAVSSPGYTFDLLIHNVKTDAPIDDGSVAGSSGYYIKSSGMAHPDITEGAIVALINRLSEEAGAGRLRLATPSTLGYIAATAVPPRNLLVNPVFAGRASATLTETNKTGRNLAAWRYDGFSLRGLTLIENGVEVTMSAAVSAREVLTQRISLVRGRRYCAGFHLEASGGLTNATLRVRAAYGELPQSMIGGQLQYIQGMPFSGKQSDAFFEFEIPAEKTPGNARIVGSVSGPFNLSINKNIKLTLDGVAAFDIDCSSGASSALSVTSSEVAKAINSAIAANSGFSAKQELWNIARAEGGKVVLESQKTLGQSSEIRIDVGTTLSATSAIFGGTVCYGYSNPAGATDAAEFPVDVAIYVAGPDYAKAKIKNAYLYEM